MVVTTSKYYSATKTLNRQLPTWVNEDDDALRVAAYDAYQDMVRNVPATFALVFRGEEDHPIYIPSARRIVEATNRYLAKDWKWTVTSMSGNVNDVAAASTALDTLLTNEEMLAKFYSAKRTSLTKGDAVFHIRYNESAPPGSRIQLHDIDPRNFFRIPDPTDVNRMIGCYITELVFADDGKTQIARRLEYRLQDDGTVFTKLSFWEITGWDDRWIGHPGLKPAPTPAEYNIEEYQPLLTGFALPTSVTRLPVYHIRNNREEGEPYGSSEIAGIETLISAVNQGASDEDISLALNGLGVYVTDGTRPVASDGTESDWVVAPGMVLEMQTGTDLKRVNGVESVIPYQDHLVYLGNAMDQSVGLSKVAVGNVDVQIAQSGVALRLDMAPILAKNNEKEQELKTQLDKLLRDLLYMWMPLDGFTPAPDLVIDNTFGDPLPKDRAGIIKEITDLKTAGLVSSAYAVQYLKEQLGFQFPDTMLADIQAEADAVGARLAGEVAAGTLPGAGSPTGGA